jgi:hypothetical protein
MNTRALRAGFGVVVFIIGVAGLARAQRFYGGLLRGWDAQFYYSLAHSFVFDGDADLTNDLEQTPYPSPFDRDGNGTLESAPRDIAGRIQSHFPVGLSLLEVPPLGLARAVRRGACALGLCSSRPPGYSDLEIWSVALGLLAVFSVAMQLLYDIVRPHVPAPWRELALLGAWLGTSLFYYSSVFPFSAHAIAFSLVVCAVSIATSIGSARLHRLALLGFALGLLYLVRPQQLTIVLPLALMLAPIRRRPLREWIGWAGIGTVALIVLIAAQALAYSRTIGAWTLNAYAIDTGGFDWSHPQLSNVLLNPARGLLWVSPIVLLAAAGFALTPPRMVPRWFVVFAVQAILQLYVMACWAPGQGDTFGARMWAECAAAVACGLGLLYVRTSGTRRILVAITAGACVVWTSRLLYLYMFGRLTPAMSHLASIRLALGL